MSSRTSPWLKTPFHQSYLLYLARQSPVLAHGYLHLALGACRVTGNGVSFLLHPLDVLSGEEVPSLRFFPGMNMPMQRKVDFLLDVLDILRRHAQLGPLVNHARHLMAPAESGAATLARPATSLPIVDAS